MFGPLKGLREDMPKAWIASFVAFLPAIQFQAKFESTSPINNKKSVHSTRGLVSFWNHPITITSGAVVRSGRISLLARMKSHSMF